MQLMSVRTRSPWRPGMKRTASSMWSPKVLVAPGAWLTGNVVSVWSESAWSLMGRVGTVPYPSRMKILVRWLLLAAALLLVAQLDAGVEVKGFGAAMIAALVLGLFNTLLRPLLVLLTLPVTVLTLGLFLFVINAVLF